MTKDDDEKTGGDTYNVTSHNQQGGITAANVTVNTQPGWRDINQQQIDVENLSKIVASHPGCAFNLSVVWGEERVDLGSEVEKRTRISQWVDRLKRRPAIADTMMPPSP